MMITTLKQFCAQSQRTVAGSALAGGMYGRICTTANKDTPPTWLAADRNRRAVFVFGPDSIELLAAHETTYDALLTLGLTKEYLKFEVGFQSVHLVREK